MTMTEPTDPKQPPAVSPVHVLLHFLQAMGGDPFGPVEANAAKIFDVMRLECPGIAADDLILASRIGDQLGRQLRRLHWRLVRGGMAKPRPPSPAV